MYGQSAGKCIQAPLDQRRIVLKLYEKNHQKRRSYRDMLFISDDLYSKLIIPAQPANYRSVRLVVLYVLSPKPVPCGYKEIA